MNIHDPIQYGREKVRRVISNYREAVKLYVELMDKFNLIIPSVDSGCDTEDKLTFSIGIQAGELPGLLLQWHDVKDMEPVMKLVEGICKAFDCKVKAVEDYAEMQRRSYKLTIPITVSAFFDEHAECKFVPIGEKTEKVYKFVCPDSSI